MAAAAPAHDDPESDTESVDAPMKELLKVQGWKTYNRVTSECEKCGMRTGALECLGCARCRVFVCGECATPWKRIPPCLVEIDARAASAQARIPRLLDVLRDDEGVTKIALSGGFDACADTDFLTWVKCFLYVSQRSPAHVWYVERATRCDGMDKGRPCTPNAVGLEYALSYFTSGAPTCVVCRSCLVQILLTCYQPPCDQVTGGLREAKFMGQCVVADFSPFAAKAARP